MQNIVNYADASSTILLLRLLRYHDLDRYR